MVREKPFLFRVVRRLFSEYERKRSYSIRKKIWQYKFTTAETSRKVFLILTTPGKIGDAAWTAASFLNFSEEIRCGMQIVFCVDGHISGEEATLLNQTFPNASVTTTQLIKEAKGGALGKFCEAHPLGAKLMALIHFNETHDLAYSDNDVLAVNRTTELDEVIKKNMPSYMRQNGEDSYNRQIIEHGCVIGAPDPPAGLNSGLLYMPQKFLDQTLAEQLIAADEVDKKDPTWWWIEQTIIAILYGKRGHALPAERYVVSLQRWLPFEPDVNYDEICVRHYVASVRHLMYSRGMPLLANKVAKSWTRKG